MTVDVDATSEWGHWPCGLVLTDVKGNVLQANDTVCRWLGYLAEELRGMHLTALLTVGSRFFHQTHLSPLLQLQGSVAEVQLQLRHRNGQTIPVLLSVERETDADGKVVDRLAFMTATDRRKYEQELLHARGRAETALEERRAALESLQQKETELRKANQQLMLVDQRKDEFLAVLGHELRNPLTPMRSGLDMLNMRKPEDPLVQRVLGVFDRQVSLMTRLVDDLMDVSRIGQGKLHLKPEPVRVIELVQHSVELAMPLFTKARQTLLVAPSPDCEVNGDVFRLRQVLVNLLNNASKYTQSGGTVWLSCKCEADRVLISVRDNGIGLEASRLADVFDLFSQVESEAERTQGGIGIGLGLVKGIVELHHGAVQALSEGLGKGSEFVVSLPVLARASR